MKKIENEKLLSYATECVRVELRSIQKGIENLASRSAKLSIDLESVFSRLQKKETKKVKPDRPCMCNLKCKKENEKNPRVWCRQVWPQP